MNQDKKYCINCVEREEKKRKKEQSQRVLLRYYSIAGLIISFVVAYYGSMTNLSGVQIWCGAIGAILVVICLIGLVGSFVITEID